MMTHQSLTLFHGTADPDSVLRGLRSGSYVTDVLEIAAYYAEVSAEEGGGENPRVIRIDGLTVDDLDPDSAALSEPVGFSGATTSSMSEAVEAYEGDLDTAVSLQLVRSAKTRLSVPPSRLTKL
jgi:hypothetical protein